jgi:hypothetical protein
MTRIGLGAAILLLVALWGCGAQPSTPAPSARPSSSAAPSSPSAVPSPSTAPPPSPAPEPSAEPTPAAPRLARNSVAQVITDDLRVRSRPEVSDASKRLEPLLDQPRLVYVVSGPVQASGYTWYEIAPIGNLQLVVELPFGWVAAADKDGTPWLAPASPRCPAAPKTADDLYAIDNVLALACFGSSPLTIIGRLADPEATCGIDLGWTIEPGWLASTCPQPPFLIESPNDQGLSANAVVDPSVDVSGLRPGPEPADWLPVSITGRFDHPAARTCHGVSTEAPVPYGKDEIVFGCRTTFVITGLVER